jgi:hypothetical protein
MSPPPYIAAAGIHEPPVSHGLIAEEDYFQDTPLASRIRFLSYRAALALAAANAEWIAWRYEGRADNTTLLQFIEAVWAGVVDPAYVNLWTTFSKPGANHPASSALTRAGRLLYSVFWGARHLSSGCTREASYVAVLARHVLADKEVFERWLLAVISRIAPLYPGIGVPDRLGVPVPREAFDPDFAFKPELATDLLRGFLAQLDPIRNPFLRKPAEMIQAGFTGKPYTL